MLFPNKLLVAIIFGVIGRLNLERTLLTKGGLLKLPIALFANAPNGAAYFAKSADDTSLPNSEF